MKKILVCVASLLVLVFSGTVYGQDICDSYFDKYQVCVEDKNASGNLDFSECKGYTDLGTCEANGCYWSEDNERCGIYICECDANMDGKVTGADLAILKKEYGRFDCPTTPCEGMLSPLGRWCDQGDGTVKDMTTCLVWLKKADWGGTYAFWVNTKSGVNAQDRAAQLWDGSPYEGTAGLSDGSVEGDWRLPTKTELVGIMEGDEYIRFHLMYKFTGVQGGFYWSGTSKAGDPDYAWRVHMTSGGLYDGDKSNSLDVWPVRSDNL